MKKIFTVILAALCCYTLAQAVPAYRGLIPYTQPDGSVIQIRLHGDEFCHWTTDASGNYLEMGEDGFYRRSSSTRFEARKAMGRIRRAEVDKRRQASINKGIASGQKHFLVILVEFNDVHFKSSTANSDFSNLMNQQGYSVNGARGSARDFYYDNSSGAFEPLFDVYGPVRLSNDRKHYGENYNSVQGNDMCPEDAIVEGCQALDSSIDFTQYDNDNDGEVDMIFMYYAGQGEADGGPAESIWPHQWDLYDGTKGTTYEINVRLDGKRLNKYACTNEIVSYGALNGKMCGIGTACHEFGHAMGLPDFYDVDYDDYNGEAGGLYDFSTMCSGSYNDNGRTPPYFNMEERILLGWKTESDYSTFNASGSYSFGSVSGNVAYRTFTDKDGEYFAYECRSKTGWDYGLPEAGLLVYHVDKSNRKVTIYNNGTKVTDQTAAMLWSNWQTYNSINENGSHPCFYVIPATDRTSLNLLDSDGYAKTTGYTFTGANGRNSYTPVSWNGVESVVTFPSISYSSSTGKVTLTVSMPSTSLNYNVIANPSGGVYVAGSSFTPELAVSEAQPVSSVQWYFDDEPLGGVISLSPFQGPSVQLSAGQHLVEAHLNLTDGSTKILELILTAN